MPGILSLPLSSWSFSSLFLGDPSSPLLTAGIVLLLLLLVGDNPLLSECVEALD